MRSQIPRPVQLGLAFFTLVVVGSWLVFTVWGLAVRPEKVEPLPKSSVPATQWRSELRPAAISNADLPGTGEVFCSATDIASRDTDDGLEVYAWTLCSSFEVTPDHLIFGERFVAPGVYRFDRSLKVTEVEFVSTSDENYQSSLEEMVPKSVARQFLAPGSLRTIPDSPRIDVLEKYQLPLFFVPPTASPPDLGVAGSEADGTLTYSLLTGRLKGVDCVGMRIEIEDEEVPENLRDVAVCADPKFKTGASKAIDVLSLDAKFAYSVGFAPGATSVKVTFVDGRTEDAVYAAGRWGIAHGSFRTIERVEAFDANSKSMGGCGTAPFKAC